MAALGEFSVVEAISPAKCVTGVNYVRPLEAVITDRKNVVVLYDLEHRKSLKNWTGKLNEEFTVPATYDHFNKRFVAIQNSKVMRFWTEEETSIEKAKKIYFSDAIQFILSDRREEPVVVFANGCIDKLSHAIDRRKEETKGVLSPKEIITKCELISNESESQVAFVTEKAKACQFYTVTISRDGMHKNQKQWQIWRNELVQLIAYCIVTTQGRFSLITFWSDNGLYYLDSTSDCNSATAGNRLHVLHEMSSHIILDIIALESKHIAILSCKSGETSACVSLWDISWGVKKATRALPNTVNYQVNKSSFPKLWMCSNHLFVFLEDSLIQMSYALDSSSLASAVGMLELSDHSVAHFSWKTGKLVPAQEKFEMGVISSYQPVQEMISRMQGQGKCAFVICRNAFTTLLELKNVKHICEAVRNFHDIPEDIIVSLLKVFLTAWDAECEKVEEENDETADQFPSEIAEHINILLKSQFTDVFLKDHLRTLSFSQFKTFMKYLNGCLNSDPHIPQWGFMESSKIVVWMSILMDAQFLNLRLSCDEEINTEIMSIISTMKSRVHFLEDLGKFESVLETLKDKQIPITSDRKPLYCIQMSEFY